MIAGGRVQGVGFRWFVCELAFRNGIRGYVKNLPDGKVQILAIAESDKLRTFADQIRMGNRHCQVGSLSVDELTNYTEYEDFFIA